jgi:hypothetical protein
MAKGAVRESVSESKYKVKTERMRDEFRRSPEKSAEHQKFHNYKEYQENPGSVQGSEVKTADCYFQSDHWELEFQSKLRPIKM